MKRLQKVFFDTWGWLTSAYRDFTSFALMKELKIVEALTADRHYELVGMGLKRMFRRGFY